MAGIADSLLQVELDAPLRDYVARPDHSMRWREVSRRSYRGLQIVELSLESQQWQDRLWTHHLLVIQPPEPASLRSADPSLALLYVTGSYDGGATAETLSQFAEFTGSPVAVLYDVPNQPLFDGLCEDALIAYTLIRCLDSGDLNWPLLYPMARSAAAAMTAIEEAGAGVSGSQIRRFVVSGASKRGWTTWLIGSLDPRVCAIIPMVYNNLNLLAQMRHQVISWREYSDEIGDYVKAGVVDRAGSLEGQRLSGMIDPFTFRDRLALPKLIVNGTNDRYWPLDAANLYFSELVGEKHLLYVPNCGHRIEDAARVGGASAAFFLAVASGRRLPEVRASFEGHNWDCSMHVTASETTVTVNAWTATSDSSDFRESRWDSTPIRADASGRFSFETKIPAVGHVAMFAETEFLFDDFTYRLSSPLSIIPSVAGGV